MIEKLLKKVSGLIKKKPKQEEKPYAGNFLFGFGPLPYESGEQVYIDEGDPFYRGK